VPCRIPKQKILAAFYTPDGKKEKKEIAWLENSYLMVAADRKTYIGGYAVAQGLNKEYGLLQQL
jgi:hypothetical protein